MDYEVVWTDGAIIDVEEIAQYIQKDSPFYADSVVTKIVDTTRLLESFPLSGRAVPEENDKNVREHFIYNYRLIYEIRDSRIFVLTVVHGKRILHLDLEKELEE